MDDSPHLEQETTANAGHSHRCENAARCTTETGLLYGGSVEQKPLLASRIAVHGKIASLKVARNRWQNKPADTMLELGAAAPLPVIPEKDATTPGL
jgi:hypothetical protein